MNTHVFKVGQVWVDVKRPNRTIVVSDITDEIVTFNYVVDGTRTYCKLEIKNTDTWLKYWKLHVESMVREDVDEWLK